MKMPLLNIADYNRFGLVYTDYVDDNNLIVLSNTRNLTIL